MSGIKWLLLWDHSYSTFARLSEKLTLSTPWNAQLRMRKKREFFGKLWKRTKWMIPLIECFPAFCSNCCWILKKQSNTGKYWLEMKYKYSLGGLTSKAFIFVRRVLYERSFSLNKSWKFFFHSNFILYFAANLKGEKKSVLH